LSGLDTATLLLGLLVFAARVGDVALGTLRTLAIVQGRTRLSFVLGFVEVGMWLVVIAAVLDKVSHKPVLGAFYALGFATGNIVGIKLEQRIALGDVVLRVICATCGPRLAERIRAAGFGVTTFAGEGLHGPVTMLFVVCRRRDLKPILRLVDEVAPDAFFTTEPVGNVLRLNRPGERTATGWRAVLKKK